MKSFFANFLCTIAIEEFQRMTESDFVDKQIITKYQLPNAYMKDRMYRKTMSNVGIIWSN